MNLRESGLVKTGIRTIAYCNSVRIIKHLGSDDSTLAGQLTEFLNGIAGHLPEAAADAARDKIASLDKEYLETNRWWVLTVAGGHDGEAGFVDGPAQEALVFAPVGLAISGKRVFVSDAGNRRIRMITLPQPCFF